MATYGGVAHAIGMPGAARAVGNALHHNPFREVPCHRVVRSDGTIGGFARGISAKVKLLKEEGVICNGTCVGAPHLLDSLKSNI
ncbi:MAG: methylated-DNA-[protein]-cysteine S-methyltransferase [Parcubacteria group bacterium Gr01-1014_48]|nr:MAG: methylated-DNA-[protein]-cysteine S-methyltransferase [Parcubacteria group bacterium Gr01-1014_48]